ncbi:MAG: hypothetical protein IJY42_01790, partial [Clostridia bacterium]|nr:hypothetical protein [Clostridia bacterium]
THPVAYKYENKNGERFLVILFEGDSLYDASTRACDSGLLKNYVTQRVLIESLPWVSRQAIPAYCEGNPDLYLMCAEEENSLTVALFNCFADALTQPIVTLGKKYSRIECINCSANLSGNHVTLTSPLHGFTYAAFRVYQ